MEEWKSICPDCEIEMQPIYEKNNHVCYQCEKCYSVFINGNRDNSLENIIIKSDTITSEFFNYNDYVIEIITNKDKQYYEAYMNHIYYGIKKFLIGCNINYTDKKSFIRNIQNNMPTYISEYVKETQD